MAKKPQASTTDDAEPTKSTAGRKRKAAGDPKSGDYIRVPKTITVVKRSRQSSMKTKASSCSNMPRKAKGQVQFGHYGKFHKKVEENYSCADQETPDQESMEVCTTSSSAMDQETPVSSLNSCNAQGQESLESSIASSNSDHDKESLARSTTSCDSLGSQQAED
ncbi:PREDICTED: sperm protein associated with the nucleus on the X chromosome N2-like [Chrysochloris asiatica]|uniref:Sperm protein associated with the nucleus on the X chromosome N2-like n=1 Tax=Chrysochloris asiatica TaxID=185453 RepID=A0A9B0TST7_CHRAS|nr:PREDICTED: sperm protein associated with the nucleus on the X chromosome N2-like [Chrysochloris asiatica]